MRRRGIAWSSIHQVSKTIGSRNDSLIRMTAWFLVAPLTFLLRILFLLSITTTDTFGSHELVPKQRPWTKVLAAFAPLDFEDRTVRTLIKDDPN